MSFDLSGDTGGGGGGPFRKVDEFEFSGQTNFIVLSEHFEPNHDVIVRARNILPSVDKVNAYVQVSNDTNATFENGTDYDGGVRVFRNGSGVSASLPNYTYASLHDPTADSYRLTNASGCRFNTYIRIDNHWDVDAYTMIYGLTYMQNVYGDSLWQNSHIAYKVKDVVNGAQLTISSGNFASGLIEVWRRNK